MRVLFKNMDEDMETILVRSSEKLPSLFPVGTKLRIAGTRFEVEDYRMDFGRVPDCDDVLVYYLKEI